MAENLNLGIFGRTPFIREDGTLTLEALRAMAVVQRRTGDIAGLVYADTIVNVAAGGIASTDVQAALNELDTEKAPKASPTFTGTPAAPTAAPSTNTTQLATCAFVIAELASAVVGLLDLKGDTDASGNPNYPAASKGDAYYITVAGKVGGASGKSVDIGDVYIAKADNAGGTEAAVGTSWFVLEHNLAGVLQASNNLSDVANATTARTNLGLGTIATQAANNVAITGGAIDGTPIGATTASTGKFTSVESTGYVKTGSTTFASLPAAATAGAGARHFITDCNSTTFLAVAAAGGANKVPVVSDGTQWLIG